MKPRMALFFDGANHTEALSKAQVSMNYKRLLQNLNQSYFVTAARYYSGISDDPRHQGVKMFLGSLAKGGYTLVTKPVRVFEDGSIKGNVDVEIAVDMVSMSAHLDRVVLFSGDGDFTYLVDAMQRIGIFVTVCSHKPFASSELRDKCNEFLEVAELTKTHNW